jgi:hypothetical protein
MLKAWIAEPEETAFGREQLGKHASSQRIHERNDSGFVGSGVFNAVSDDSGLGGH